MSELFESESFRQAMRRTAASVAVVTTDGPAGAGGLTVSSLCSLSMSPPALIFCANKTSRTLPTLLANGVFAANFLSDEQSHVADVFAGLVPEFSDRRFAIGSWALLETGAPILAGALCNFDCRVVQNFEFNTHRIVIGEVVDMSSSEADPLIFAHRRYWRISMGN